KQARIEFRREKGILKSLNHPVDDRDHHFDIEIIMQLAAFESKADELHHTIGVFGEEKAVDFPLEHEIGSIVTKQRDAIRNPVFVHEMFRTSQPIAQDFEEALLANV